MHLLIYILCKTVVVVICMTMDMLADADQERLLNDCVVFSGADDKDSPLPGARQEENEKTREKMQLVRSQMENMSLIKQRKAKVCRMFVLYYSDQGT